MSVLDEWIEVPNQIRITTTRHEQFLTLPGKVRVRPEWKIPHLVLEYDGILKQEYDPIAHAGLKRSDFA